MKYKYKNSGFTLIELLVVISIISVLSSFVFSSVSQARMNARDAKRMSDIRQIRLALELYRNANGDYPIYAGWATEQGSGWSTLQTALAPYMPKLPIDPINNGPNPYATDVYAYAYRYEPSTVVQPSPLILAYPSRRYDLIAQLENKSSPYRCELKLWKFRFYDDPWCGLSTPNSIYSDYIYSGEQ